jgi:hypothetical protein
MIIVNLTGRLGNQLFQYSCARALQEIYSEEIQLNITELNTFTNFEFELGDYILNENVSVIGNKPLPWYADLRSPVVRVLKKFIPNLYFKIMSSLGIFVWQSSEYKELPIVGTENKIINGWWQSDKYFNNVRSILVNEIVPKNELLKHNYSLYEKIQNSESVCITIRRGNYVDNPSFKKKHFVCDNDYFQKAIDKMQILVPNCVFFVFSDDIEWVKSNMNLPENSHFEIGDDPVWEKLRIMSACKHFIISNSTFSWWAQYLSINENKVVIAPSKWYADGRKADLHEESWKIIDT